MATRRILFRFFDSSEDVTTWGGGRLTLYAGGVLGSVSAQQGAAYARALGAAYAPETDAGRGAGEVEVVAGAPEGSAYYSSPGGAGDYAEASSNVAARVVFPGASAPVCTVAFWAQNTTVSSVFVGDTTDTRPIIECNAAGGFDVSVRDNVAAAASVWNDADPASATWEHFAVTCDGTDCIAYGAGSAGTPVAIAGTYAAADEFFALRSLGCPGDVRNIMVIDRALTAGEVAALYAAGPTHNPLNGTGAWAAGQSIPVIWCTPAVGGRVVNSGDGGTCDLVLAGNATSEVDPGALTVPYLPQSDTATGAGAAGVEAGAELHIGLAALGSGLLDIEGGVFARLTSLNAEIVSGVVHLRRSIRGSVTMPRAISSSLTLARAVSGTVEI
jgi:hypothetical protein